MPVGTSNTVYAFLPLFLALNFGAYAILAIILILCLLVSFPIRFLQDGVVSYRRFSNVLADILWGLMIRHVEFFGGWNHVYSGDVIPRDENVFVISNHKTWLDWLTLMSFAARKNRLGAFKMFAKQSIALVPGIGWGMWLMNMVFLSRDWNSDSKRIMKTFESLRNSKVPFWIGSHLEGTRFSEKKHTESQEFAKAQGRRCLQHCLLPRTKGFLATVEGLRPSLGAIYDVTLVYDHQRMRPPSFSSLLFSRWVGQPVDVHLHVRRFPITTIPAEPKLLEEWVFKVWEEKDELLDHFFKHDAFPSPRNEPFRHIIGSAAF